MQATLTSTVSHNSRKGLSLRVLNSAVWVLQVLLAVAFLLHGWLMVAPPVEMIAMMNAQLGVAFRLFIGVAELLAVVGLILPALTRIMPQFISLAAAGLMIVMASATVFHTYRGEIESAITTAILFVIITAVAYLRWKVVPIVARTRG